MSTKASNQPDGSPCTCHCQCQPRHQSVAGLPSPSTSRLTVNVASRSPPNYSPKSRRRRRRGQSGSQKGRANWIKLAEYSYGVFVWKNGPFINLFRTLPLRWELYINENSSVCQKWKRTLIWHCGWGCRMSQRNWNNRLTRPYWPMRPVWTIIVRVLSKLRGI